MRILVTGVDGYIGCVLVPRLLQSGHEVVGLDTGFYRDGWLYSDPDRFETTAQTICRDLRKVAAKDLEGFDAVVHLAELSNDPLGENNPEITHEINHMGSFNLAKAAVAAGVPRFVYTSSCSVYGVASEDVVSEESKVNPQTAYADCKVLVERDVGSMANEKFCPVFLRNATAYGPSPRMRFDIVLNNLAGLACTTGKIAMTSDGQPWRPLVHVADICKAVVCALEAPDDAVCGQIFNVGCNDENYRVREIAEFVKAAYPECELTFGPSSGDNRSYKVNFDKITNRLPGFSCEHRAADGAFELRRVFDRIQLDAERFGFRSFTRLRQLEYLIRSGQIDDHFYWI
ncbi:MAG: SDR family oxidoreductase [Woeseiaceae bacterium]